MRTVVYIAGAVAVAVAGFIGGYAAHTPQTVTQRVVVTQDQVGSFNDGWCTALGGRPEGCHTAK